MSKPNPSPPNLTEQDIQRFWSKISKEPGQGSTGDCWEWQGYRTSQGYGHMSANKRNYRASRIAYLLAFKEWPGEFLVCHRCDNPPCCNPAHLFLGTYRDNAQDCHQKGRHPIMRGSGHVCARLTEKAVIEMRRQYAAEDVSYADIAIAYGVRTETVAAAITGITWKHVPNPVRANESKILRGEKVGTSKLTAEQVSEIKAKYIPRKYSARRLAREYGMHRDTIEKILNGTYWKHIK